MSESDATPPAVGNVRVLTLLEINVGQPLPSIDLRSTVTADASGTTFQPVTDPTAVVPTTDATQRYDEIGLIGRGGLGEVIDVFDRDLRRHVALKRTLRHTGLDICRLVAEAQVTAQLEHPNIPSVHAIGIDGGRRPYFTMARIEGMSLAGVLEQRHHEPDLAAEFTPHRLLRVFLQIGYAVAFAHERRVLHRDIKPANVMVGRFGEVRVMDWGLARVMAAEGAVDAIDVDTPGERPHSVVGTPGYMAPEQCESEILDCRTDIYALGATLYEMLSGHRPTGTGTSLEIIGRTVKGAITPLTECAPAVRPDVARIVHRALERKPADRYATVVEMLTDIEAVLDGRTPPSFTSGGALSRFGHWYMDRSWRSARLRPVDIDLGMFGATLAGVAIGLWLAPVVSGWLWPVLLLVLGAALCVPMTVRFARGQRPDDPDRLATVMWEGVRTDSSIASHSETRATVDPAAETPARDRQA